MTLSASAADDVAVNRVEFYVGQTLVATASAAPYQALWNSGDVSDGPVTIKAKAYDAAQKALSLDQYREEAADGDLHSLAETLESQGPGPIDSAQGKERRARIRASVDRLPDFLRQVLLLAYYQGLKYREIAEILGIPVGTVKSRLHAALVKLQEVWGETPSLYEV